MTSPVFDGWWISEFTKSAYRRLEWEMVKRAYAIVERSGRPGKDYVGNPNRTYRLGQYLLEVRMNVERPVILVIFENSRLVYQEKGNTISWGLLGHLVELMRKHMVLDDLASV
jgi:hypothetical protein